MLKIVPFCVLVGVIIGSITVLDIFAVKEAKKANLERPDFINLEEVDTNDR